MNLGKKVFALAAALSFTVATAVGAGVAFAEESADTTAPVIDTQPYATIVAYNGFEIRLTTHDEGGSTKSTSTVWHYKIAGSGAGTYTEITDPTSRSEYELRVADLLSEETYIIYATVCDYVKNCTDTNAITITLPALEDGGLYTIHNNNATSAVLDVDNASRDSGANVQVWSQNRTGAQIFIMHRIGVRTYTIENLRSGKYLDAAWAGTTNGTNVQQYDQNDTCAQKWYIGPSYNGGGGYQLRSACSNLVMDFSNGNIENGTNVQLFSINHTHAQSFSFYKHTDVAEITNGTYNIKPAINTSKALDISNASADDRANLQIWTANGTAAQDFKIERLSNGFYKITNTKSGKVLDVDNAGQGDGTNVQQFTWNGTTAQQWLPISAGDGYYYFMSRASGSFLDVSGAKTTNGTNVQIWTGNSTAAQKFKLVQK